MPERRKGAFDRQIKADKRMVGHNEVRLVHLGVFHREHIMNRFIHFTLRYAADMFPDTPGLQRPRIAGIEPNVCLLVEAIKRYSVIFQHERRVLGWPLLHRASRQQAECCRDRTPLENRRIHSLRLAVMLFRQIIAGRILLYIF
jgi:hypothetical protein